LHAMPLHLRGDYVDFIMFPCCNCIESQWYFEFFLKKNRWS
jgi:hypothetical protein